MKKRIITVQHAESLHHVSGMVGSRTDWALTEEGREQAENLAVNLKKELGKVPVVIYSSDQLRTQQTAQPIAETFGVETILSAALREQNLGEACGKTVRWLREHMAPEKTADDRMFPDAESRRDVWNRLQPFYDEVMNSEAETIIIVSHGALLCMFYTMFMGLTPEQLSVMEVAGVSAGVSVLKVREDGKHIVCKLNDTHYAEAQE